MSALECECVSVLEAIAALESGSWFRAAVWLRLADEAANREAVVA
jgi:hypothetical protein